MNLDPPDAMDFVAKSWTERPRLLRRLQEVLLAANLVWAVFSGSLIYLLVGGESFTTNSDAGYYFLRGEVRVADLLHLGAINAVSTDRLARGGTPISMNWMSLDATVLASLLSVVLVALPLLSIVGARMRDALFHRVCGAIALFAAPGCCVTAFRLARTGMPDFWVASAPFGSNSLVKALCGELVGFVILALTARRRPIPSWTAGILLVFHFGFWCYIVLAVAPISEAPVAAALVYLLPSLLWLLPSVTAAWLAFVTPMAPDAPIVDGRRRAAIGIVIPSLIGVVMLLVIWLPARGYSLTEPKDLKTAVITFSRGPCYGMCPSYSVTIHGDGSVEYVGGRFARRDRQTGNTGAEAFTKILRELDDAHFSTLEDRAFSWCFDTSSVSVTVSLDGRTKRVSSDASCTGPKGGLQERFVRAAEDIDTIVDSERWARCEDGRCRK